MTPDELRRLDNDLCIIFEKGIKPVKAKKFYYFKHPMAKEMARCEISHNDIGEIDRGTWRKYNPYNPYIEEKDEKEVQNLKVESLDDLFDDDPVNNQTKPEMENTNNFVENNQEKEAPVQTLDLNDFEEKAPILPQDNEDEMYDLQKELEAKFDELFGPLDDN